MLVMSKIPEKRKPMKDQKTKITAYAHAEFVSDVNDEYNRLVKKNLFFGQKLPAQTFVGFLDLPEEERDRRFRLYLERYEALSKIEAPGEGNEKPAEDAAGEGFDIGRGGKVTKASYRSAKKMEEA